MAIVPSSLRDNLTFYDVMRREQEEARMNQMLRQPNGSYRSKYGISFNSPEEAASQLDKLIDENTRLRAQLEHLTTMSAMISPQQVPLRGSITELLKSPIYNERPPTTRSNPAVVIPAVVIPSANNTVLLLNKP